MSRKRYSEEFKKEVKQITEGGYTVADVASRLGTTTHSLYTWRQKYSTNSPQTLSDNKQQAEINHLKAELKRVPEERDILKKAAVNFAKESL